ncbi:MAG: hypothetical protein KUG68_11920 [Flavobacteriaceae bacterium]|nr:hypothetical protein [Flavobacteriaceae bacterium]
MKTSQLPKVLILTFLSLILIYSCSSDDSGDTIIDPQTTLEEEQAETTQILSSTNNKTWKISQAILSNENATIDISTNFNIIDDEFIFNSEGNLNWRQGNDINIEATSNQESLLDYYRSPISSNYNFNSESSTDLNAFNGRFSFTVVDEFTITGIITYAGKSNAGGQIEIVLNEKQPNDYIMPVTGGLNFTEAFTFQSNAISCCAPGMIGSNSDNSLFLVTREDTMSENDISPERIIKFNIDNSSTEENLFFNTDFVSKQLHIINNELVVIGGQYVNTYPLDFSSEPNSTLHGLTITRFGMSVSDEDAYIIGGDLNPELEAEKIYKWSLSNQTLDYVADLPEDRFGARSAIVNNKLYSFGGTTTFATSEPAGNDSIYIYDLINGGITTEQMTSIAEYTYVDKYQNLIYIAGYHTIYDNEGNSIDYEYSIGVYDTQNGTYQEIENDLNPEGFNNIYGMCIFNGKMYVIFGSFNSDTWQIMTADL